MHQAQRDAETALSSLGGKAASVARKYLEEQGLLGQEWPTGRPGEMLAFILNAAAAALTRENWDGRIRDALIELRAIVDEAIFEVAKD